MLRNLFGGASPATGNPANPRQHGLGARAPRRSSGWGQMLRHCKKVENLRVLDVGPTSSNNINYLTGLGHSIYMADLVQEAADPVWRIEGDAQGAAAAQQAYDIAGFLSQQMEFAGRKFDVVLLWDALDFLPAPFVAPVVARLCQVCEPGALLLGFFHSPMRGTDAQRQRAYSRYHLTDEDVLLVQPVECHVSPASYNNRDIEKIFAGFSGSRFLLAKDNMREVIVTR